MTLSKVKLLALTAMLACGLTAGTGGVIVRIADAQAPPVAKPADPAKPPAAKTPTADEQKWAPDLIPPAPKSAEFEYKYTLKNLIPDRLSGFKARLEEEASKGWEFSGMITTSMTAKELSELAGRPGSDELERTVVGETAVLVFKKRKPAPAMPSEPGIGALLGLADPVPTPIAKPARAQVIAPEGFTVQHSYSFAGITKTTVYEKGAVVAPEHYRSMAPAGALMLRFRSESANDAAATLRRMFDKPVHVGVDDASNTLIVSDATPEQKATIIQLTVNFDDSPKAANPVPFPAPPRVRAAEATSSEQVAVCTKGFDVTEKPTNGINMAYNYAPGDTIRARHLPYAGTNYTMLDASLVESFKPKLAPNGKPYVRAAGQSSTLVIVPVGEILTLKLKTLNAEAVAAMCREALPKTAEVYTEQMTNSISVNNATPADLEKLKRMIEVIDKPAATPAPTVTQELAAPNVVPVPAARDPLLSERLSPQDVAPRPAGRTTGQQGSTRGAGRPEPVPTQAQPAEPEKFDPVVLRLKHIDAPTAAMLGNQVVMPPARRAGFNTGGVEAERVVALQASNSIVIFNTPPADVERIRKLLNEIDKPATQPRPMADSPAGAYYVPQMQHRLVRPGDDAIPDERGLPSPRQYDSRPPQLDLPSASAPSADRVPPQVMPTRPPALFDERPPQLDLLSPVLPSPVRGTDSPPPSAAKPKKPKGKATIPPAADNVPQVTPERIHGGTL